MMLWLGATVAVAQPVRGRSFELSPDVVEGRYQMTLSVTTKARVPVLGWLPSTTVSTVLVDLTRDDAGWWQRHEVCNVQILANGKKARTQIPPAFVNALPVKQYAVSLTEGPEGWAYRADLGVDHVGYDPDLTPTVPREPTDPGVIDPDGDGRPGMTVLLKVPLFGTGELYVAQRGHMELDGRVAEDGTIGGQLLLSSLEQRTLWATNRLFRMSPPIKPVPQESWFRLERADGLNCVDIGVQPEPE